MQSQAQELGKKKPSGNPRTCGFGHPKSICKFGWGVLNSFVCENIFPGLFFVEKKEILIILTFAQFVSYRLLACT